jgi:hypothetical protein
MKTIIRLTESDLHKIVKNSVKRILKEDSTFDNHIAGNIYDDIIQRGLYRRLQPNKLKDFIMNSYGLKTSEEGIADTVVNKIMKYKTEMETQYGLTESVVDMNGNPIDNRSNVVDMMGRREDEDMAEHIKKVYTDENGKPMIDELLNDLWESKLDQYVTNQKFCKGISVWILQNRDYRGLKSFNEGVKWRREQLKIKDPDKRETKIDLFLKMLRQEAEKLRRE